MIGPSNPIASIGPILAVPGMREALADADAPVVAVSPLVGGRSLKGPTEAFLSWAGLAVDDGGIAACYAGLAAGMVVDRGTPTGPASMSGIVLRQTDTLMPDGERARPARERARSNSRLLTGRIDSTACDRSDPPREALREREAAPRRQARRPGPGGAGGSHVRRTCWPRWASAELGPLDGRVGRAARRWTRAADARGVIVVDEHENGQSRGPLPGWRAPRQLGCDRAVLVPGDCPLLDPPRARRARRTRGSRRRGDRPRPARHRDQRACARPRRPVRAAVRPGLAGAPHRAGDAAGSPMRSFGCRRWTLDVDTPRGPRRARGRARALPTDARAAQRAQRRSPARRGMTCRLVAEAVAGAARGRAGRRSRRADRPRPGTGIAGGDVVVVSQKVVSKAEGRLVRLADVTALTTGARAGGAARQGAASGPAVLDESAEVLRAERGVLITRTHHGLVCANAGVDRSNVPGDDIACLLPADPDALRARARAPRCREGRPS